MPATTRQRTNGPVVEWIVCGGADRDVGDGTIECPITGEAMPLEACLACHHLGWAAGERDRPDCQLGEFS